MAPHLHQSKVLAAVWKHLVTEKMRWVGVIELLRMYLDLHRTLKMEISSPEGRKVSRSCVLWSLTLSRVFSVRLPASSNPAVIQYLVSGGGQLWGQPQQSVCYFFLRILRKLTLTFMTPALFTWPTWTSSEMWTSMHLNDQTLPPCPAKTIFDVNTTAVKNQS